MGKRPSKTRVVSRLRPMYQPTFIRAWREYREMSQEELAEKVGEYLEERGISEKGYTHASIGRIENGKMPYKQPIMEGIADALDVTVAMLIAQPPPSDPNSPTPDDDLRGAWNNASADDRIKFVQILKTLTGKAGAG
jgi:transcriptional regulator with XRE-family HTH domain